MNTDFQTEYFPNPYDGYQTHTQANISSAKKYTDFNPETSLEMGINLYIPEIKRLSGTKNI